MGHRGSGSNPWQPGSLLNLVCVMVNVNISGGSELGVGGEVWAETMIVLVFPAQMCS